MADGESYKCRENGSASRLRMLGGLAVGMAAAGVVGLATYIYVIRPWHLRWHTSLEEASEPMPGDDLVADPSIALTRALTIEAPPASVWPWLVQMGYRRAGWYSYDFFDNDNVHVYRILPEHQELKVGDIMRTDAEGGFRVEAIDPGKSITAMTHSQGRELPGEISICMMLRPLGADDQQTRMTLRLRARFWGAGRLWGLLFDFSDFLFMRKMLLGIKERAEAAYRA